MSFLLDVIVPQLARPHGLLSPLVAQALDSGNRAINLHAVGALDLQKGERVLELGFGGGVGLATVLAHEPSVVLAGIDISVEMKKRCARRFGSKVRLAQASVDALPFEADVFDKAFGVNVSYFWPDIEGGLRELRRVLVEGGLLVLGIRPIETLRRVKFHEAGHRVWSAEQYVAALTQAGFATASARRMPDPNGGAYVVTARNL